MWLHTAGLLLLLLLLLLPQQQLLLLLLLRPERLLLLLLLLLLRPERLLLLLLLLSTLLDVIWWRNDACIGCEAQALWIDTAYTAPAAAHQPSSLSECCHLNSTSPNNALRL